MKRKQLLNNAKNTCKLGISEICTEIKNEHVKSLQDKMYFVKNACNIWSRLKVSFWHNIKTSFCIITVFMSQYVSFQQFYRK